MVQKLLLFLKESKTSSLTHVLGTPIESPKSWCTLLVLYVF